MCIIAKFSSTLSFQKVLTYFCFFIFLSLLGNHLLLLLFHIIEIIELLVSLLFILILIHHVYFKKNYFSKVYYCYSFISTSFKVLKIKIFTSIVRFVKILLNLIFHIKLLIFSSHLFIWLIKVRNLANSLKLIEIKTISHLNLILIQKLVFLYLLKIH